MGVRKQGVGLHGGWGQGLRPLWGGRSLCLLLRAMGRLLKGGLPELNAEVPVIFRAECLREAAEPHLRELLKALEPRCLENICTVKAKLDSWCTEEGNFYGSTCSDIEHIWETLTTHT